MSLRRPPAVDRLARVPFVGRLADPLFAASVATEHALYAQLLRNPVSRSRFRERRPSLAPASQRAFQDLATTGIAILDVRDVGLREDALTALLVLGESFRGEAARLVARPAETSSWLAHNGERVARYLDGGGRSDDYLIKLHPEGSALGLDHPLLRVGLDRTLLDIVNSYLGLFARLIYTDMWQAISSTSERRIGSQRWHRDYDDARMVKAYLYLADVGPDAGPMEYVRGSHDGGKYRGLFPWRQSVSRYVPDGGVESSVRDSDRIVATGPAGTLVLSDTSGLHRGGPTISGQRVLATWTFVTPACLIDRRFRVQPGIASEEISEPARYALS